MGGVQVIGAAIGMEGMHIHPCQERRRQTDRRRGAVFPEVRQPSDASAPCCLSALQLCELAMRRHGPVMEQHSSNHRFIERPANSLRSTMRSLVCDAIAGQLALLVIDIDRSRIQPNELFGRDVGDALIRAVGQRIAMALAPDMTFRTGGDEFTVIVQDGNRFTISVALRT